MGFNFTAPVDLDSEAYLQEYGRQRRLWLAERGGFDAVEDDEGVVTLVEREAVSRERGVKIIAPKKRIEMSELGTAPKRVYWAAKELGLEVQAWLVVNAVDEVLYVADSKEGDKNQHSAGDVLYEAFIARRYCVEARHPSGRFGFQAHYMGKGETGTTAGFDSARVRDLLGIEVENWADYTKDKVLADMYDWSKERTIQEGMAANRRINDGSTRLEHIRYFFTGGEFTTWLDDYLRPKGIKTLTPNRKPKATPEDKEAVLLSGGEWNG